MPTVTLWPRSLRLGHKGAVDDQSALVQAEGGVLYFDVARQAGSRQEGVVGSVIATEVCATAVWKVKVPAEMGEAGNARPTTRSTCLWHLCVGARVLVDKHRWYSYRC